MLAPGISLSPELDVVSGLLPVANRGEVRSAGRSAFPVIEQDGLAGAGLESGKRRDGRARRADILAVGDRAVVLLDGPDGALIAVFEANLVVDRIGSEINKVSDPQLLPG